MTDTFELKAELRDQLGTKKMAAIRESGKLPAVIYGHKQETVSVAVDYLAFTEAAYGGTRIFAIDVNGKKENVLIKDVQYDHLGKDLVHVDFIRVDLSETVHVNVSLNFKGNAIGVAEGGIIDELMSEIEVECVVTNIPESIVVPVGDIKIDDTLHVSDVVLPEGVKLISNPEATILTCHMVAAAVSAEDEAEHAEGEEGASAEPEVITAKNTEEDNG